LTVPQTRSVLGDNKLAHIKQLLDEAEQKILIGQWRADQLFADAERRGN